MDSQESKGTIQIVISGESLSDSGDTEALNAALDEAFSSQKKEFFGKIADNISNAGHSRITFDRSEPQ